MELLELLKMLNSQGQQAQVETLREAIVLLDANIKNVDQMLFWLGLLLASCWILTLSLCYSFHKRLKKIELANGLKVS